MKLKTFILLIGLILSVPGFAGAQGTVPDTNNHHESRHHGQHKNWQAKMAEREQQLLTWVGQYTPEKKAEWAKVLSDKQMLLNQWMSPENTKKREQWKSENRAKFAELKKQFEEGKITKEQFVKKLHGGKEMGHWKTYRELKQATDNKDNKQAAALLNQLLSQYKQHNEKMKAMLAK